MTGFLVYKNTTQAYGTGTDVTWQVVEYDDHSGFASNVYTVPAALDGKVMVFRAGLERATTEYETYTQILINGTNYSQSSSDGGGHGFYSNGSTGPVVVSTGDVIKVNAYTNSSGTLAATKNTYFSGEVIEGVDTFHYQRLSSNIGFNANTPIGNWNTQVHDTAGIFDPVTGKINIPDSLTGRYMMLHFGCRTGNGFHGGFELVEAAANSPIKVIAGEGTYWSWGHAATFGPVKVTEGEQYYVRSTANGTQNLGAWTFLSGYFSTTLDPFSAGLVGQPIHHYDFSVSGNLTLESGRLEAVADTGYDAGAALQSNSGIAPTVGVAALNGLDAALFDGSNDYLWDTGNYNVNAGTDWTWQVAFKSDASGSVDRAVFGTGATNADCNHWMGIDATGNYIVHIGDSSGNNHDITASGYVDASETVVLSFTYDYSLHRVNMWVNMDHAVVDLDLSPIAAGVGTQGWTIALGSNINWAGTTDKNFDGHIGEFLAYDYALNAAQVQSNVMYLRNKWAGRETRVGAHSLFLLGRSPPGQIRVGAHSTFLLGRSPPGQIRVGAHSLFLIAREP